MLFCDVYQDALFTVSVVGLLVNCVGMAFFWEQHAAVCADENCLSDHGGSENLRALFLHVSINSMRILRQPMIAPPKHPTGPRQRICTDS